MHQTTHLPFSQNAATARTPITQYAICTSAGLVVVMLLTLPVLIWANPALPKATTLANTVTVADNSLGACSKH